MGEKNPVARPPYIEKEPLVATVSSCFIGLNSCYLKGPYHGANYEELILWNLLFAPIPFGLRKYIEGILMNLVCAAVKWPSEWQCARLQPQSSDL